MAAFMGYLLGALVILYLVSRLVLLAFKERKSSYRAVLVSDAIALATASFIAGYGNADDGAPNFAKAFVDYLVPALLIVMVDLFRVSRFRKIAVLQAASLVNEKPEPQRVVVSTTKHK